MEELDAYLDLSKRTLLQQFQEVKDRTVQSHVARYGDAALGNLTLSEFQGDQVATRANIGTRDTDTQTDTETDRSEDVPLIVAQMQAKAHLENKRPQAKLQTLLAARAYVNSSRTLIGRKLIEAFGFPRNILCRRNFLTQHECYQTLFESFNKNWFNVSPIPMLCGPCSCLSTSVRLWARHQRLCVELNRLLT